MTGLTTATTEELAATVDQVLDTQLQRLLRQGALDRERQERYPSGYYPTGWAYLQPAQPSEDRRQWIEGCLVFLVHPKGSVKAGLTVLAPRLLSCGCCHQYIETGSLCAAGPAYLGGRKRSYFCLDCCTHRPSRPRPKHLGRPYHRPAVTASVQIDSVLEQRLAALIHRSGVDPAAVAG